MMVSHSKLMFGLEGKVLRFCADNKKVENINVICRGVEVSYVTLWRILRDLNDVGLIKIKKIGVSKSIMITKKGVRLSNRLNILLDRVAIELRAFEEDMKRFEGGK